MAIARYALTISCCALLAGCSAFGGKDDDILPGERIAVGKPANVLEADSTLAARRPMRVPAPTSNAAWPMQGGTASHAPQHVSLSSKPLREIWSTDIGKGSGDQGSAMSPPVVYGSTIAAMDASSTVSLLDSATGKVRWQRSLMPDFEDQPVISGGLAHGGRRLYAATGFAEVAALETATGKTLWTTPLSAPARSAPTLHRGRLFVITAANELVALDADSGSVLWTHLGLGEAASLLGGASPAANREMVIAGYSSGELAALNPQTGRVLWSESLAAYSSGAFGLAATLADIAGYPVLTGSNVLAASNSGQMALLDSRTGRRLWTKTLGAYDAPWSSGNSAFIITNANQLAAISLDDGSIYWLTQLAQYRKPEKRKGTIVWTAPLLAGGLLYTASSHGMLLALDPSNGKVAHQYDTDGTVSVAPVVAGNTLYLYNDDGEIQALQ